MRFGAVPPDASRSRLRGRPSTPPSSGAPSRVRDGRGPRRGSLPPRREVRRRSRRPTRTEHPSPCSADRGKGSRSEGRESRGGFEKERSDVVVRVARHRGPPGALIGASEHPAQRGSERSPDGIARPMRSRPRAGPRSSGGRWLCAGAAEAGRERRRLYGDRPMEFWTWGRLGLDRTGEESPLDGSTPEVVLRKVHHGPAEVSVERVGHPVGARGARRRGRTHPGRCPRLPHGLL